MPTLPRALRIVSAAGALLQPLIFYPLWIAMLLPLMSARNQFDSLYSVFILDLCFIMPAFLLLAVLTFSPGRWVCSSCQRFTFWVSPSSFPSRWVSS